MANQYTRKAIQDEFLDQLSHKPLNKITVSSIVQNCRINRNTFYYYYQDIYDLLRDILNSERKKTIDYCSDSPAWEDWFLYAIQVILQNPEAIGNLYHSSQQNLLHDYLFESTGIIMRQYILSVGQELKPQPADVELLTLFYQCALTELVEQWLENGMTDDAEKIIRHIGQLMNGTIREALIRSENLRG